jgi:hypothetical protein
MVEMLGECWNLIGTLLLLVGSWVDEMDETGGWVREEWESENDEGERKKEGETEVR